MTTRWQPSATARGYGRNHRALRLIAAELVRSGAATCWRCGLPITPRMPFDLGHDDVDRTKYRGPEHALARDCPEGGNRATRRLDRQGSGGVARQDPQPRRARWS